MSTTTTPRTADCHNKMQSFFNRVRAIFTTIIPSYIDAHISGVMTFIEGVRAVILNPVLDNIVMSLEPQIKPEIFEAIKKYFDGVIELLGIELACKDALTFNDKIRCFADHLSLKSPEFQNMFLHGLAVHLARATSQDEKMTETELSALVAFAENEIAHKTNRQEA